MGFQNKYWDRRQLAKGILIPGHLAKPCSEHFSYDSLAGNASLSGVITYLVERSSHALKGRSKSCLLVLSTSLGRSRDKRGKSGKNRKKIPLSPAGGHPFFVYHIRGKNDKNRTFSVFTVFTGGAPLFFQHIRGKKTVKIEHLHGLPFLPGGRSFCSRRPVFCLPYSR